MSLDDIRIKLDRAKEHLDVLNREIDEFAAHANPLHVVTYGYNNSIRDFVWTKDVPRRWGALVGDCVHNLRSAVDHIAWDLAGGEDAAPIHTEFPIFLSEAKYLQRTTKPPHNPVRGSGLWKIEGIADLEARTVIRRLQPFNGADPPRHPLWIVHELDRLDKHRSLHPIWGYGYTKLWKWGVHDRETLHPGWRQVRATAGPYYPADLPSGTSAYVKMRFDLALRVTLPPETVGSHENIDVVLAALIAFIESDVVGPLRRFL